MNDPNVIKNTFYNPFENNFVFNILDVINDLNENEISTNSEKNVIRNENENPIKYGGGGIRSLEEEILENMIYV